MQPTHMISVWLFRHLFILLKIDIKMAAQRTFRYALIPTPIYIWWSLNTGS